MQIYSIHDVHIDGIAACVPEKRIENEFSLRELYGDDASLIMESTGIKARYVANPGTTTSDLCIASAKEVMEQTHTTPEEIGGIVFVTFTPDRLMPFNAAIAQTALGISKETPAFDINLACSGYPYGLYIAATLVQASKKKILLLDGDVQSAYVSAFDKSTVPVLADGGSATLLSYRETEGDWKFSFYTDGGGRNALTIPSGGTEKPMSQDDLLFKEYEDGKRRDCDIYMDGFAVFRFVAMDVSKWLMRFLERTEEAEESLDFFVPHQANMYMIKKLAKRIKIKWEKTWKSGDAVGNSASATVPITIAMNANDEMKKGQSNRVLISGFGAGLSASAGLITLDPEAHYEFFQYK